MRTIAFDKIVLTVEQLVIAAAHELPPDVISRNRKGHPKRKQRAGKKILEHLLIENAKIA